MEEEQKRLNYASTTEQARLNTVITDGEQAAKTRIDAAEATLASAVAAGKILQAERDELHKTLEDQKKLLADYMEANKTGTGELADLRVRQTELMKEGQDLADSNKLSEEAKDALQKLVNDQWHNYQAEMLGLKKAIADRDALIRATKDTEMVPAGKPLDEVVADILNVGTKEVDTPLAAVMAKIADTPVVKEEGGNKNVMIGFVVVFLVAMAVWYFYKKRKRR